MVFNNVNLIWYPGGLTSWTLLVVLIKTKLLIFKKTFIIVIINIIVIIPILSENILKNMLYFLGFFVSLLFNQ